MSVLLAAAEDINVTLAMGLKQLKTMDSSRFEALLLRDSAEPALTPPRSRRMTWQNPATPVTRRFEYELTGLLPGREYHVRVRASDPFANVWE